MGFQNTWRPGIATSGVKASGGTGRKVEGRDQLGRGQKQVEAKGSRMVVTQRTPHSLSLHGVQKNGTDETIYRAGI